ncbi:MAG: class II aldolase/adducin family protein [Clostridia bacterium]
MDTINRVYRTGLTTTSGGNISAIDENGNIFITPSGIDKGTLSSEDIVKVLPSGEREGKYKPSMELPFHSNIYNMRHDIHGVVHAHAPAIVAYATARAVPNPNVARCYKDSINKVTGSTYDLPGSLKLGEIVKRGFEQGYNAVMMDNHGATVGADTLAIAYQKYETLDFLCQTLINAQILGGAIVPREEVASKKKKCVVAPDRIVTDADLYACKQIATFLHRSYDNKLVGAEWGTIALRVGEKIYFNPDNVDRKLCQQEDICIIEDNACVRKCESIYSPLIEQIFATNKEVNAIFISMPSATMGFAVSRVPLESKLIPESYIMLKNVVTAPYGSTIEGVDRIANKLTVSTPAMIVDNECAITIGANITKAFDRMEVLDYSARSIIMAKSVANITPINAEQVQEIDDQFNGW